MPAVRIRPISDAEARAIVAWRYDPPYDVYGMGEADLDTVRSLLLPENSYYAILQHDDLIGFCCFGHEAQVPGGDYGEDALDVGIGLRPNLTGQGLGGQVIAALLDVARQTFGAQPFRATIAAWNRRSIRTFEKLGFKQTATFRTEGNPASDTWVQLVRGATSDA